MNKHNNNIKWPPGIKPPSVSELKKRRRRRTLEQIPCKNGCGRKASVVLNSFCSTTCAEAYRLKSLKNSSETSQKPDDRDR